MNSSRSVKIETAVINIRNVANEAKNLLLLLSNIETKDENLLILQKSIGNNLQMLSFYTDKYVTLLKCVKNEVKQKEIFSEKINFDAKIPAYLDDLLHDINNFISTQSLFVNSKGEIISSKSNEQPN